MPAVKVNLDTRSYNVEIGYDITHRLARYLKKHVTTGRVFVIYDARFYALHGPGISKAIRHCKIKEIELVLPAGEKTKTTTTLQKLYNFLLDQKISRSDFILACGGGIISDITGFVAATTLRGIRWGIVSTTLLSMVDASIGGKTGINHSAGKNLIGAIWQPSFVYCDTMYLNTLPSRELISGLGEIIKYAGLIGNPIIDLADRFISGMDYYDKRYLLKLIHLSAKYKAEIVSKDEQDNRMRMFLNLGHTFGHALESTSGYRRLSHGEAVLVGLIGAIELSCLIKPVRRKRLKEYHQIVEQILPLVPSVRTSIDSVLNAMLVDKKRCGTELRFVLLDRPGKPFLQTGVEKKLVRKATDFMLTTYHRYGGKCV